jgi:hypothetical protein
MGFAANILVNSGFETGVLAPWTNGTDFCGGCTWAVTGADSHSGSFSAEVSGNRLIVQSFAAVAVSSIIEASLWLRMPETGIAFVEFSYSDASTNGDTMNVGDAWTKFDLVSLLSPGKDLVGFGVYGCSGCAGASVTRADDFLIDVGTSIPEPTTGLLFVAGSVALALFRHKRSA